MFPWSRKRGEEPEPRREPQQAEGYVRSDLETFVRERTGASPDEVRKVLDMYDEYLMLAGIIDVGKHTFVYYAPGTSVRQMVADTERVAADAPALAGVDRDVAARILDAEFAYLQKVGLA